MFHKVSFGDDRCVIFDLRGKMDYLTQQRISYVDGIAYLNVNNPYQFSIVIANLYDIMEVVNNVRKVLNPDYCDETTEDNPTDVKIFE